jgi:hypothetical protein
MVQLFWGKVEKKRAMFDDLVPPVILGRHVRHPAAHDMHYHAATCTGTSSCNSH